MGTDKNKVADRLRAMCSRREYCRADIMKKAVAACDGDVAAAASIVETLVEERYIDDLRYASAFARDKASIAGWGGVKIKYMLSSKGISRDMIEEALEGIDEEKASGRLYRIMELKAKALKEDGQKKLKLLRFGLGRGYGYDEVNEVIDQVLTEMEI